MPQNRSIKENFTKVANSSEKAAEAAVKAAEAAVKGAEAAKKAVDQMAVANERIKHMEEKVQDVGQKVSDATTKGALMSELFYIKGEMRGCDQKEMKQDIKKLIEVSKLAAKETIPNAVAKATENTLINGFVAGVTYAAHLAGFTLMGAGAAAGAPAAAAAMSFAAGASIIYGTDSFLYQNKEELYDLVTWGPTRRKISKDGEKLAAVCEHFNQEACLRKVLRGQLKDRHDDLKHRIKLKTMRDLREERRRAQAAPLPDGLEIARRQARRTVRRCRRRHMNALLMLEDTDPYESEQELNF